MDQPPPRRICFVVMGFGKKTDYQTGRVLDLDKSYKNIIKPAVEAAGMQCLRADEIAHSGVIDAPIYEQLLTADVVIADLSTTNPNAIYDLGVRHALRPYTTIIIAESQFKPFFYFPDPAIHRYQHLGEDIGYSESLRMREDLTKAIQETIRGPVPDSPVYTFLRDLRPPERIDAPFRSEPSRAAPVPPDEASISVLVKELEAVTAWPAKVPLLQTLRSLRPDDPYYTQQLALATYKSKSPDEATALSNARQILSALHPETSTDPETLGLWGAIHKRIWDAVHDRSALDVAIDSYEKGFLLKNDYYNGINYAFLLNVRATQAAPADAVADFVLAQRVRRKVIAICEALLAGGQAKPEDEYWIRATLAEAHLGVGDRSKATAVLREASKLAASDWMRQSTNEQLNGLERLLAESPLPRFGLTESAAYRA